MPSPDYSDIFPEAQGIVAREIVTHCRNEALQLLADIKVQLAHGETDDCPPLWAVLLDEAGDATAAGDIDRLNDYVETLFALEGASCESLVQIAFMAMDAGSERGAQLLHRALQSERDDFYNESTELLDSVVQKCAKDGTPPNAWIDTHALDNAHAWELYIEYFEQILEDNPEDQDAQSHLEAKAAELLEEADVFSDEFLQRAIYSALCCTKDPQLRINLVQHFRNTFTGITSLLELHSFARVGSKVLEDPRLVTKEVFTFFTRHIEEGIHNLRDAVDDSSMLMSLPISWKMRRAQYEGASPQELVTALDLEIGSLVAELPDVAESLGIIEPTQESAVQLREGWLAFEAHRCSKKGEFATARFYISNIANTATQTSAFDSCLYEATTLDHINDMRPDELWLGLNPDLRLLLRFATAQVADDLQEMAELAVECARDRGEGYTPAECMKSIYELISERDAAWGLRLAKELVDISRDNNVPYVMMMQFSLDLIRNGDAEEISRAYDDISREPDKLQRIRYMWQLARAGNDTG